MSADLSLSSALQRRLVAALLEDHSLPWRIQQDPSLQDVLCEVVDVKRKLVVICANETEAVELIDAAMALSTAHARADLDADRTVRYEERAAIKPKNASDLFDKLLPITLAKHAEKARAIATVFGFVVDDDEWTVDCTATPPACSRGDAGNAMCKIVICNGDLMRLIKNPDEEAIRLYFQGKLVVNGDPVLLTKLPLLFTLSA